MATLKVKDSAGQFVEISNSGVRGPAGGTVPTGGDPGQVLVKTGPGDLEVGWANRPRVALNTMVGEVTSHATANSWLTIISGTIDIDPDRMYHVFAGVRCIQDPGATVCTAEAGFWVGSVQLAGNDLWTTADTGLWGAWSQNWLSPGTHFTATPATLGCNLDIRLSAAASKKIYSPRIQIIEY